MVKILKTQQKTSNSGLFLALLTVSFFAFYRKMEEVEHELLARIDVSMKYVPQISHLGNHMRFTGLETLNKLQGRTREWFG